MGYRFNKPPSMVVWKLHPHGGTNLTSATVGSLQCACSFVSPVRNCLVSVRNHVTNRRDSVYIQRSTKLLYVLQVCAWVCGSRCAIVGDERKFCHFRVSFVCLYFVCHASSFGIFPTRFVKKDTCEVDIRYEFHVQYCTLKMGSTYDESSTRGAP